LERALAKKSLLSATAAGVQDTDSLRKRFVETCKGYLGVPYGKKHLQPGDPDYDAPLFLDCCGLIRRALLDLQADFGFKIGRWNQGYQFETLPVELTFEQLRPGDLIFVEGTYHDPKRLPQRHNMVHVEVFIGGETSEATIGSRWSKSEPAEGKVRGVQIHPSYKYVSKKYEIHKFHFRSISTWLNGTCRSTSYADATATVSLGGKSIFEDEAASDEEDENGAFVPDPYKESPVFYVGEGNNWKAVAAVLEQRGWRRLPFEASFTTRFDLKWVEQRARIDYFRHVEGQLVNHIPNNDVITSKAKFLETIHKHHVATGERFTWHPPTFTTERAGEKLAALAEAEAEPEAVWILKPSRGNGGKGIELVKGTEALKRFLFPPAVDLAARVAPEEEAHEDNREQQPPPAASPPPVEGWVVQRYIENPLLLQGRKFDIRAYCLVARTTPHLWFFHPGYCKVAFEPYDGSALDNRFMHLTNACVQKGHPQYGKELRGKHIWSLSEAEADVRGSGHWEGGEGSFWSHLHHEMKLVLAWLFRASVGMLERRKGYFDLWGVDFMVDSNFGLHLLEVNSNPAIFFDSSPTLEELVPRLLSSTVDVVLEAQKPRSDNDGAPSAALDIGTAVPLGAFEPLIDEASRYIFGQGSDS